VILQTHKCEEKCKKNSRIRVRFTTVVNPMSPCCPKRDVTKECHLNKLNVLIADSRDLTVIVRRSDPENRRSKDSVHSDDILL